MNKILLTLRTLVSYALISCALVVFVPPCFIIACLPASWRYDNKVFFFLTNCFYKSIVFASFNRIIINGAENLPREAAIFVANHQSAFDIPVLGMLCRGYPHVWLVLEYYVDTPIIGFFIRRMFVPVDRSDPGKAARSLIRVYRFISDNDRHLLIFPEGGRFTDGTVHPFFEGFAVLARKIGRSVIPVYFANNGKIYPPYSFYIYPYPIIIDIGKPFICGDEETAAEFTERVRAWFVEKNKK